MSQPVVPSAAQELYDRLAPIYGLDDEANDWALLRLCEATAAGLQLFDDLDATDASPAWGVLFDIDRTHDEWLPWLAWVLGIVQRGETSDQLRALARDRAPAKRATPPAMRAAVASTLTGTKTVRYIERASHPFRDLVITSPSETPDPAATAAAAETQQRAFSVLTVIVTDDPIIDEGTVRIDDVPAGVTIDSVTLADIT